MDLFNKMGLPFKIPHGSVYSFERSSGVDVYRVSIPNGELIYVEHFFDKRISDRTVEYFQENDSLNWRETDWKRVTEGELSKINFANIKWKQDNIKLYGKSIPLPRLTSWYGEKNYAYSGITSIPNGWNKGLLYLKNRIEQFAGVEFNSVLLNWYRDGQDYLNWHADDEKELGVNPIIASANFGETREFVVRRSDDPSTKIIIPLKHGTLLVMRGELQHFWQHSVPKRTRVSGSRFNLTFRQIRI